MSPKSYQQIIISQLKSHCQVFLEFISQGGPTDDVVRMLAAEWDKLYMEFESSFFRPSPSPISPSLSTGILFT